MPPSVSGHKIMERRWTGGQIKRQRAMWFRMCIIFGISGFAVRDFVISGFYHIGVFVITRFYHFGILSYRFLCHFGILSFRDFVISVILSLRYIIISGFSHIRFFVISEFYHIGVIICGVPKFGYLIALR